MSLALVVEIIGDASKLTGSLDSASKSVGGFGSGIGGTLLKVGAVAGVAGLAATAIADMTAAAAADRDEQLKLQTAIEAAGAATGDYMSIVDAAIAQGQEKAFTDSETREAMQSLVTATGDVGLATEELAKAQDIARLANVDLATAADAVAKAHAGQDGPLAKLIPGLQKGATATDTLAAATELAAGQADAYAKSSAGMQAKAGDAFGELSETIGEVFLPILDALLPALIPILQAFGQLVKALLPILIPMIQALGKWIGFLANVLVQAVNWLVKLVQWIGDAIGAVGRFLEELNPLANFKMPSLPFLNSTGATTSSAPTSRSGVSSMAVGPAPVVNIYTTGDGIEAEQAVVRALRRVTRINGGVVPALGWTGGGFG